MIDPRPRVEAARLASRLSQAQLAGLLGVTQGHYSKVVTAKVPLSEALRLRMQDWLGAQGDGTARSDARHRMQELAASIRRECMELMHLVETAEAVGRDG
jgi:transcriptional regulator with XRE-family HTH domain